MVETAGDVLQHVALAACVFAGDCQNPEKNARHLMTVSQGKNRRGRASWAKGGGSMFCN